MDNFFDELDPSLLQFLILAILGVEAARMDVAKPAEAVEKPAEEPVSEVLEATKTEEVPKTVERAEAVDAAEIRQVKGLEAVTYIYRSNNRKRLKPRAVYF